MKNYFDQICTKLKKEIEIEDIQIVDKSHKHKGHKFFRWDNKKSQKYDYKNNFISIVQNEPLVS